MAHSTHAIVSVSEIPALVRSFANSLGFITSGADPVTIRHPSYMGAKEFTLGSSLTGTSNSRREQIRIGVSGLSGASSAIAESPKLNPTQVNAANAVIVVQPTQLHLFGNCGGDASDSGNTWIAGVIEYGYNLYRHFYMGYVEKITEFGGGEVITGSAQVPVNASIITPRGDSSSRAAYPFSLKNLWGVDAGGGGLHVDHPGNATPWRTFFASGAQNDFDAAFASAGNSCVLGGYLDSINSGYMGAGKSAYSGAQILTPINLYIGKRVGATQLFQAVGAPFGVRLVHMEDLEPGALIPIGTSVWRVFPVFAKRETLSFGATLTGGTANVYPPYNTSQYIGQAYLVSE